MNRPIIALDFGTMEVLKTGNMHSWPKTPDLTVWYPHRCVRIYRKKRKLNAFFISKFHCLDLFTDIFEACQDLDHLSAVGFHDLAAKVACHDRLDDDRRAVETREQKISSIALIFSLSSAAGASISWAPSGP